MGDGKNRKELEEKTEKLGINNNVTFLGRIDNVNEYINAMDIMLLPSLYEGLPNVVLEWQASGIQCLVSDRVTTECKVSDLVEFLNIYNGVKTWVDKILNYKIFEDNKRKEKSEEGCQGLKDNNFEITSNVKKLESIYIEKYKESKNDEKNKIRNNKN